MITATRTPGARNGVPEPRRRYRWRAPRPPWMAAAIAQAEHEHGPPRPTCVCGNPLRMTRTGYATCPACGHRTGTGDC